MKLAFNFGAGVDEFLPEAQLFRTTGEAACRFVLETFRGYLTGSFMRFKYLCPTFRTTTTLCFSVSFDAL